MNKSKVVARFRNGETVKGYTTDFSPVKSEFHIVADGSVERVVEIRTSKLKALFFVKSLEGDRNREKSLFDTEQAVQKLDGMKIKVTFHDREVLYGTTNGYLTGFPGFFLTPADRESNSDCAFVVAGSAQAVDIWHSKGVVSS